MKKVLILAAISLIGAATTYGQLLETNVREGKNSNLLEILPTQKENVYTLMPFLVDDEVQPISVKVYDAKRKLIFSREIKEPAKSGVNLDFSALNPGDYLIEATKGFIRSAKEVFIR